MERKRRPIIAVNLTSGDVKQFTSEKDAERGTGVSVQAIQSSRVWGGTSGAWRFHDTPENIRKRIARLEEEIKYLEGLGL